MMGLLVSQDLESWRKALAGFATGHGPIAQHRQQKALNSVLVQFVLLCLSH